MFGAARPRRIVVKTYGAGSLLGLLSPIIAFFMASRGMRGWQESAARDLERDAIEMAHQGYRIASSEWYELPLFGIGYEKVTYELSDSPN